MNHNTVRADISGIPVHCTTFNHILTCMNDAIQTGSTRNYISITNTESMYHALRRPEHMKYIRGADFSCCDGVGSVVAGLAWGKRVPRLNGPILMLKACEFGQQHNWKHFFYGGAEGVADQMVENLQRLYPKMISVGTYCPPFRALSAREEADVMTMIRNAEPDIVWVGLGLLKQECWIAEHIDAADVPWMVGVGAAFDYHAGTVPWAPKWVQAIGMEWLFRTIIQPRKRLKRYYWSLIFVLESIWQSVWHRLGRRAPE